MTLHYIESCAHEAVGDLNAKAIAFGASAGGFGASGIIAGPYGGTNKVLDFLAAGSANPTFQFKYPSAITNPLVAFTARHDGMGSPLVQFVTGHAFPGFGQLAIGVTGSGRIKATRGHGLGTLIAQSSDGVFPSGDDYAIEVRAVISNTVGEIEVRIAPIVAAALGAWTTVINVTGVDTVNRDFEQAIGIVNFGIEYESGNQPHYRAGNFVIMDTGGAAPFNTFLGGSVVSALFPDGTGSLDEWTGTYADVDDATPDGDTTFVTASATGTEDLYTHTDPSASYGPIAIQHVLYAKRTGGSGTVRALTRVQTTTGTGIAHVLTDAYAYYIDVDETSPVGSWNLTRVIDGEFGQELTAGAGARVSQRVVEVLALTVVPSAPPDVSICTLDPVLGVVSCVEVPDATVAIRHELDGPGQLDLWINRNSVNATSAILGDGLNDVRVVRVTFAEIDEDPIVAGFLETGDFTLISSDEEGGEMLHFGGRLLLSYLDFAVMWHSSYLDDNSVILMPTRRWIYTVSGGVIVSRTSVAFAVPTTYSCAVPPVVLNWPSSPDQEKYNTSSRKYVQITSGPHSGKYVHESWLAQPIANEGTWRLWASTTGKRPGQILRRIILEAQAAGHPAPAIPLVTMDFDYTNDSSGDPWDDTDATDEFTAEVGESLLSVVGRLVATGTITVELTQDFVLHAYNRDRYGVDRSSLTFASDKVRFVRSSNIVDQLSRELTRDSVATHGLVAGDDNAYAVASLPDAASRVTRHAFIRAKGTDATALEAAGESDLTQRLTRGESARIVIANRRTPAATGETALTGYYLPGDEATDSGDFWTGDTVTLHTGTGNHDFANVAATVAALTIAREDNDELLVGVELFATGGISEGHRYKPTEPGTGTGSGFLGSVSGGEAMQARAIREALEAEGETSGALEGISSHTGDTSDAHDASAISIVDAGAYYTGTDVEAALQEIGADLGGAVGALDDLTDVTITSPADADRLRYNATSGQWENSALFHRPVMAEDPTYPGPWFVVVDGDGNAVMEEA